MNEATDTAEDLVRCQDCLQARHFRLLGVAHWHCALGHHGGRVMFVYTGPNHDELTLQALLRRRRRCGDFESVDE